MEFTYCLVLLSAMTLSTAMTTSGPRDTTMAYNQTMITTKGSTNTTNGTTSSAAMTMSGAGDTTVAYNQTMVTMKGSTDGNIDSTNSTRDHMYDVTTAMGFNCSYPGQECKNGNCSSAFTCDCHPDFSGNQCDMYDGCQSSPCHNNGTCHSQNMFGEYQCSCTTGDPAQNCLLNEENDCEKNPPNSVESYITCLDLIGSRMLYCAPAFNDSTCRTKISDSHYCSNHGCLNSTYCKPLCNVMLCNETDVCRNFTALAQQRSSLKYHFTECRQKFANGFTDDECSGEAGLYDGYDSQRVQLKDCNPFFNTTCTRKFSDGACDVQCNNTDCLYDGGDCMATNSTGSPLGFTVIRFSQAMDSHAKQIKTKLSLFARSVLQIQFSNDGLQAGLRIMDSNFTTIAVASKFIAAGIGKLPGLVDYVADVYTCEHGKSTNGTMSCDTNCSSTCIQSGDVCNWSNGSCLMGCQSNHWGDLCQYTCPLACNGTCDRMDGRCLHCSKGTYGTRCEKTCDQYCVNSECNRITGLCTCTAGHYLSNTTCMACSDNCANSTCDDGNGHCSCRPGYYGAGCMASCSRHCKGMVCSIVGVCSSGCKAGYHGQKCNGTCPKDCDECNRDTGKCIGGDSNEHTGKEPQENNMGVIIAILIALLIVIIIILIAICCWCRKRKESGDYIVEDEEMECPVKKADTMEVKRSLDLQPVSPFMGRSTDMIELDEKQAAGVYAGPRSGTISADLDDRNPDGKSTNSDESVSPSENDKKKSSSDDDEPATGVGAPLGRKKSSLKITLSINKTPSGEMSPKSPQLFVINDKTGQILSPLKMDNPEQSVFVMPDSPLKSTMAPLASEEDLLSAVGPKLTTPTIEENEPPIFSPPEPPIDKEDNSSRKSSSSSDGKSSKRSSKSSEGKRSKKSKSSSSSSDSEKDDDEKLSEYDENKEPITEM